MNRLINWILSLFKENVPITTTQPQYTTKNVNIGVPKAPIMPVATTSIPHTTIDLSKWGLVPELEAKAIQFLTLCSSKGYSLRITQGLRTMKQQQALYNQGRTTPGRIITNAKPGQSQHNFGKAFDVAFIGTTPYPSDDKLWKAIADIGVSCGLTAGYYFHSFQDKPHFQI